MSLDHAKQLNEHKDILDAQGKAFHELKGVLETQGAESTAAKESLVKIEATLDTLGEKSQEMMISFTARETAEKEMKEHMTELEAKLTRPGAGADPEKEEYKLNMEAFNTFARKGIEEMSNQARSNPEIALQLKRLRTDSNIEGGYLLEDEFVREIIKDITETSPIRSIARVRQTNRKTVMVPTRTANVLSGWNGEGIAATLSNSKYGQEEMTMGKLSVASILTNEVISDASFNMEVEVRQDVAEEFSRAEGKAFVDGSGVNRPEGFLENDDIQTFTTGTSGEIKIDDLINITGELKVGYDPVWVMNRRTIAQIRQLKAGDGQYLWQPAVIAGDPDRLLGDRVVSAIDMPDIAVGQVPIAYGDFRRGYWIIDRNVMSMIRDPFTRSAQDEVVLTFHRRLTGQVVKAEAIKTITIQS